MKLIKNLFLSLSILLFSNCNNNPFSYEPKHYKIIIQPGPEGEDTFVKFEYYNPYLYYNKDNFGDSSRIQVIYIKHPFIANQIKSEGLFKIPDVSSLEDTLNIDSVSMSLHGRAWLVPFYGHLPVFKANGIIDDFEENGTCWDDSLRSDMIDYDIQSVDTTWSWTTWNFGNYSKLRNLEGIIIRPLEYGIHWLSDYVAYSSDETDSTHLRPKWTFYCSSK